MAQNNTVEIKIKVDAQQGIAATGAQSTAIGKLVQNVNVAQTSILKMTAAVAGGQAAFALLGGAVKAVFSDLPRALLDGAIAAEKFTAAFITLTGSAQAAAAEQRFVREEANRLGISLSVASDGYLLLAASARGTVLEGEGARKVFTAVSGAASALGLSGEETSGALLAIGQMMSKGSVQAEELRGQLGERLPGAFSIAARAMGVSTAQLSAMLDQGQLLADDFLPKFADQLAREIPASADTTQAALNRLGNATEEWRRLTGAAMAVALDGAFGLKQASADLGRESGIVSFAHNSAKAIAVLGDVLNQFVQFVPNVFKTVGGALAGIARDIKLVFDLAGAVVTQGIGEKGRAAMKQALADRNAFIAGYNADLKDMWFPKLLTQRVDDFFGNLSKQQGVAASNSTAMLEASLTKQQQETINAIQGNEAKLSGQYKAHAQNLYAALTSGALSIEQYNTERKKLDAWYAQQRAKLTKGGSTPNVRDLLAGAQAELTLLNDGLKRAQTAYDAALQQRLISIKGYYAAKTAIDQQGIDADIAKTRQQLAAQQAQATGGKTENDRLRARAEVAQLEADLIVLNNKRADVETANAAKAAQAEQKLADALRQARTELAQITGTETAADRRTAIAAQYADLRTQLAAEGQDTALIDRLIDVKAAQANLNVLQAQWQQTLQAMRDAQQAVSLQQQAGLLTPAQATQQTAAIQQQGAGELAGLLPGMEAAANAIGPEQVAHIQAWRNELAAAQQVADEMTPVWNDIGSTFSSALQGMVQGTQTWAQALYGLFKGVSDAFLKHVVIDPFQQWVAQQAKMLAMKLGFAQQEQAVNTATAAQTVAAKTAETTTVVSANAAQAGSGAASALASIPYVGPALAVAGMAAMVAAVMALLGKGFATGGLVRGPGTGTSDSIPARLSAGEYVVRAAAVRQIGTGALDAINGLKRSPGVVSGRMAFAAGGLVPAAASASGAQPQAPGVRIVNAIDPSITADFMNSPAGEKVVLNIISRNPRAVRAAME